MLDVINKSHFIVYYTMKFTLRSQPSHVLHIL